MGETGLALLKKRQEEGQMKEKARLSRIRRENFAGVLGLRLLTAISVCRAPPLCLSVNERTIGGAGETNDRASPTLSTASFSSRTTALKTQKLIVSLGLRSREARYMGKGNRTKVKKKQVNPGGVVCQQCQPRVVRTLSPCSGVRTPRSETRTPR